MYTCGHLDTSAAIENESSNGQIQNHNHLTYDCSIAWSIITKPAINVRAISTCPPPASCKQFPKAS